MYQSPIVELKTRFLKTNQRSDFLAWLSTSVRVGRIPVCYQAVYLELIEMCFLSQLDVNNRDQNLCFLDNLSDPDQDFVLTLAFSVSNFLFGLNKLEEPRLIETAEKALQTIKMRLNGLNLPHGSVSVIERELNAIVHSPTNCFQIFDERLLSLIHATYEIAFYSDPIESARIAIDHIPDINEYLSSEAKHGLSKAVQEALEEYLLDY